METGSPTNTAQADSFKVPAKSPSEDFETSCGEASTCSGTVQADRLDVAYDDYPYEASWSLQSLVTGTVVAAYGFDKVTELDYMLLICCCRLSAWSIATSTSL
jgi:hypothetical protein